MDPYPSGCPDGAPFGLPRFTHHRRVPMQRSPARSCTQPCCPPPWPRRSWRSNSLQPARRHRRCRRRPCRSRPTSSCNACLGVAEGLGRRGRISAKSSIGQDRRGQAEAVKEADEKMVQLARRRPDRRRIQRHQPRRAAGSAIAAARVQAQSVRQDALACCLADPPCPADRRNAIAGSGFPSRHRKERIALNPDLTLYDLAGADTSLRFSPHCWKIHMAWPGVSPRCRGVSRTRKRSRSPARSWCRCC